MSRMIGLAGALLLLAPRGVDAPSKVPTGWVMSGPPGLSELQCARSSRENWGVSAKEGRVAIHAPVGGEPLPKVLEGAHDIEGWPVHIAAVRDGYVVGASKGEWGGWLRWYSADGRKWKSIGDETVIDVLRVDADTVLAAGSEEAFASGGHILWIVRDKQSGWRVAQRRNMAHRPIAMTNQDGDVFVLTLEGLSRVSRTGEVSDVPGIVLGGLTPNSLVSAQDDTLWIGAGHYILRAARPAAAGSPWRVEWLLPSRCGTTRYEDGTCVCAGK